MEWKRFTYDYRNDTLGQLGTLITIEAYKEAALNLVLPPDWKSQLDRLNRVWAVRGTTAIEGNKLSEGEVAQQIDINENPGQINGTKPPTKEQLQARNADLAMTWVRQRFSLNSKPVRQSDLLEMHRLVTTHSDVANNVPGQWRTFSLQVGSPDMGGVHLGAPYNSLPKMMEEFIAFINHRRVNSEHPVIRALLAHFFLVTIHPFGDGNGRVSRLLEAGMLFEKGYNVHGFYGLSNYFYQNEILYKTTLQKCRSLQPFDLSAFINFGLEGFAAELKGINSFIKTKLNRVVYRTMLVRAFNRRVGSRRRLLNNREYNLLHFLLTETEPEDPFSDIPSRRIKLSELREANYVKGAYSKRTARTFTRELLRLHELGFIGFTKVEDNESIVELDLQAIGRY